MNTQPFTTPSAVRITEADYRNASRRLAAIFDASPGTNEYSELRALYKLLERYEMDLNFRRPDSNSTSSS
ncbi:MAG: hypothetical protein HKL88_00790 [Bacteroidia bacterium]|nr:hypothetical protein [Bacteroidia bacterium]